MTDRLKEIRELVGRLEAAADDEFVCGVDCGRSGSCNVDYLLYDAADFMKELLTMIDKRDKELKSVLDDSKCARGILYDMDNRIKAIPEKPAPQEDK